MVNAGVWILLLFVAGGLFWIVLWADRKMNDMKGEISGLENAFLDDVLDAVDDLIFPITDEERELVKKRVLE
jgi:high-affinity Fe2+/Pb2+ permease